MTRSIWLRLLALAAGGTLVPHVVRSEDYMSVEQAQRLLFPGGGFRRMAVTLSPDQKKAIERASGERVRTTTLQVWRAGNGAWFIVDEVLGKHEFITWALALSSSGEVRGIEILTYRETYGHEIKLPKWRAQFTGKTVAAPVKIDADIRNISGATLSCVHITDGVRRLLQTHAIALRHL